MPKPISVLQSISFIGLFASSSFSRYDRVHVTKGRPIGKMPLIEAVAIVQRPSARQTLSNFRGVKAPVSVNQHYRWWLAVCCVLVATSAKAAQTVREPFLGVKLYHRTETSPRLLNINVVEIDLSAPGIRFQVSPAGPQPRPLGSNPGFENQPMETIRQAPRLYADAAGAQIAINASYFSSQTIGGVFWANNLGLTVSNGDKYSPWQVGDYTDNNFDDALNITQTNQAFLVKMPPSVPTGFETLPPVSLYNTVTGKERLLQNGNVRVTPSTAYDPRTAIGLTASNTKLLLMTVDGRQPDVSDGVSLFELANYMAEFGATNAIGMDGGGSTELAMNFYGDGSPAELVNSPSESERLVGTSLAVFALPNGDYNDNGVVDAADYVVWRNSIGGQVAYDAWRQRFGSVAGSGSSLAADGGVPEPSGLVSAFIAFLGLLALRANSNRRYDFVRDPAIRNAPARRVFC